MHKGDKEKKKKPKTEFVYFPSCNDMDEEELNEKQHKILAIRLKVYASKAREKFDQGLSYKII